MKMKEKFYDETVTEQIIHMTTYIILMEIVYTSQNFMFTKSLLLCFFVILLKLE